MYKFQMHHTRNKKPDLKDKILGVILHIVNAKKKHQKFLETISKFNKAMRQKINKK